ncbi:MAG: hypothetical protein QOF40_1155, partial [Actinomycetota bacterium]|nr:hypothetical protein [Actinomycetota bacterium]
MSARNRGHALSYLFASSELVLAAAVHGDARRALHRDELDLLKNES